MIIKNFMEVAEIERVAEVAEIIGVSRQWCYSYIDDDTNVSIGHIEKMIAYLQSENIEFKLEYKSDGKLCFNA